MPKKRQKDLAAKDLKPGLRFRYQGADVEILRERETSQDRFGQLLDRWWSKNLGTGQEGYISLGPAGKLYNVELAARGRHHATMANGNGKKTGAQLDREINDILVARRKREARERESAALRHLQKVQQPRSSGIPSQSEYERNEMREARQRISEIERAPLADRKEAAAEFLEAMRNDPDLIAERIRWLLNGDYGYGEMLMAKQVLGSPRMSRPAALTHMIAAFEWQTPNAMARSTWNKLTKGQQTALDKAVLGVIKSAESED